MNYDIDILSFGSMIIRSCSSDFTLVFERRLDVTFVRNLAINLNWWRLCDIEDLVEYLCKFDSVEKLILFVEEAAECDAEFVRICEEGEGLIWNYDHSDHESGILIENAVLQAKTDFEEFFQLVCEDETHQLNYLCINWEMPEFKAMKLKGRILDQVTKDKAGSRGWLQ